MTCKVHFTMSKCSLIIPLKVNNIKKKHWERFLQVGLLEFWVNDFMPGLHLASLKLDLIEHSCFLQYIAGSLFLFLFSLNSLTLLHVLFQGNFFGEVYVTLPSEITMLVHNIMIFTSFLINSPSNISCVYFLRRFTCFLL